MNWPWRLRPPDTGEGQRARERAERDLERIKRETTHDRRLARTARELRERNHWGETIAAIARKERPT